MRIPAFTSGEVELWWGGGWARHLPGQPRIPEHNVDDFHDGGDGSYGQVVVMVVMMVMVIMTRCDPIYWTFWGKTWSNCAEGPAGQLPLDSEQKGFSLKHAVPFFIFRVEISDHWVSRLGGGVTSISDDIFIAFYLEADCTSSFSKSFGPVFLVLLLPENNNFYFL